MNGDQCRFLRTIWRKPRPCWLAANFPRPLTLIVYGRTFEHLAHLRRLHAAAGELAWSAPEVLAHPEAARSLEDALTQAMIRCLTDGARLETDRSFRNHLLVMARLEDFLAANPGRPLYLSEFCAATIASERTIRICCQEHLGMGPVRYLWLRRMHLARRALLTASEGNDTVTSIAMAHGFWELGRFSVAYRGLFGETPTGDAPPARRITRRRTRNSSPLPVFA